MDPVFGALSRSDAAQFSSATGVTGKSHRDCPHLRTTEMIEECSTYGALMPLLLFELIAGSTESARGGSSGLLEELAPMLPAKTCAFGHMGYRIFRPE